MILSVNSLLPEDSLLEMEENTSIESDCFNLIGLFDLFGSVGGFGAIGAASPSTESRGLCY